MVNCSAPAGFIHAGGAALAHGAWLSHNYAWAHFWYRIWNAVDKAGSLSAGHQPAPTGAWLELQDGAGSDLGYSPCHDIPAAWPRDTL